MAFIKAVRQVNMRFIFLPFLLLGTYYPIIGQQIDGEFARDGLFLFKELGMDSSQIVDYNLTKNGEVYALYESDINRNLIRLLKNGHRDVTFNFTSDILNNEGTTPVAMSATANGNLVVLSNLWNGFSWMIHINEFYETGELNLNFGNGGIYTKSILDNTDDNFGQYLHTSPNGEIVVVAKVNDFSVSTSDEKIAILKLFEEGKTLSRDYGLALFRTSRRLPSSDGRTIRRRIAAPGRSISGGPSRESSNGCGTLPSVRATKCCSGTKG